MNEQLVARIGTTLAGKYKLTRLLGVGGMGAVFEGTNTWTDRRVAIKLMLTGNGAIDPELAQRFMREAKAATKIAHENIVDILDMGQDSDGSLFIVQELLSGFELRRMLDERGALSPREAVEILAPVMSALIAAHKHGIVHRDIKPENLFLAKSSSGALVPKLIDFGIAKIDSGAERGLTRTGAAMGTPHYMSPEQARGDKVDAQTDVWAIGVVLYEMLSGTCPYDGDNYNQLLVRIATEAPRPIEEVAPKIPTRLAAVVKRALERDRAARFRSMQHFLGALLDAGADTDLNWNQTLRSTLRDALTETPTTPANALPAGPAAIGGPRRPSTFDEGPGWASGLEPRTTLGRTAREIDAAPRSPRRWIMGAAIAPVVVGLVAFAAARLARRGDHGSSHAAQGLAAQPSMPLAAAGPAPTTPTFVASVSARPATAVINIDGEATNANSIARAFPLDGRPHFLIASAPGYQPIRVEFVNAPPNPVIDLVPASALGEQRGARRPVGLPVAGPGTTVGPPVAVPDIPVAAVPLPPPPETEDPPVAIQQRAEPQPAAPMVSGPETPSRNDVIIAMNGVRGAVTACGEGLTGTATVFITFANSGHVTSADVSPPLDGTAAGACIASAVSSVVVHPFTRPTFTVNFPFRFVRGVGAMPMPVAQGAVTTPPARVVPRAPIAHPQPSSNGAPILGE